ncbi:acetyl-CoA synthetase-like protein [Lophiostoma macrostomum CBS 122681]|uniref:Acetyl-CoA synthetase-like protein n=1 Tax=Lophiostoma macrostomum CBS 122681 TaxID=1314788 RepID=A0A6A6SQF7_9PLEO|nr:acetyl-CoA synthetase-like protein [Lophiostoma macrostomum CBS 122681]
MEDRVFMVPKHAGSNILPNTPLFSRLLRFASRVPARVAIDDVRSNQQRTHLELLSDVLVLRETILNALDSTTSEALERRDEVYIAIVAAGGYEYTVAMLAVLALGAAAVPIAPALPIEEAAYFIEKSQAALVLVSSFDLEKCCKLEKRIALSSNEHFQGVPIGPCTLTPTLQPTEILISSDRALEENEPAVVIFTSGTTGPPKGAVMRRAFVFDCAMSVADHYRLTAEDVMLHVLPVHHATGVGINFFPFLVAGSRIEFRSGGSDEVWMWERWKQGAVEARRRLTFFSGVPTIYMRMQRHYQRTLSKLQPRELAKYIAGARQFKACLCGTSALPQPLSEFWTSLMQKAIVQRYGATEFGAVFKVGLDDKKTPDGSVGQVVNGIDVKLSDGDQGEILVKSPHMFSKYLRDPEATANAHDDEGYFKTGDIARREGRYYWIVGRASLDIIKTGGYKISALDIERELLALPYIGEAMVVGVADEEFGQRVAALVSLQEEELTDSFLETNGDNEHLLTIQDVRRHLQHRLASYKMPTLLRILDGELPKTATGKVQKKVLGPRFFPTPGYQTCPEVQQWQRTRELAKL